MIGTVYHRNVFDRMGDAVRAFKGLPAPAQLYPPPQSAQTGFLTFPGWSYLEKQSGTADDTRAKTATSSPWVFADISAIANEFSAAELIVKERQGARLEDVDNHDLEVLWEAPTPHLGRSFLMKYWAWSYTLTGKAYLYWLPAQGALREVWPIPPFMIAPHASADDFIDAYVFRARPDAPAIPIPAEYITYSHSVNLWDLRDGLSFLAAAMTGIESDLAMQAWNRNFFQEQNGVPDGLITINKDTLDTDLSRIRQELRDFFGGTRRGVAVARAGDMDYKPFGRSQKEVEFKEGIELASKVIGRTLGFPDGYWSETANRANAEQARATMIAGAVWPLLVSLAEDLNAGIVRRFYGEQYRVEFRDIRPEDRALKLQELQFYAQIETVNELRQRVGTDKLGDPRGEMLIAEITKGAPLPATPAAEETEAYLTEQEAEAAPEAEAPPAEAAPEEAAPPLVEAAPVEALPPEAATVPEAEVPMKALDLERWERKALKSLKRLHTAAVRFESTVIPLDDQSRIRAALVSAQTVAEVRQAFKAGEDDGIDALIDDEWAGALAWAKQATDG